MKNKLINIDNVTRLVLFCMVMLLIRSLKTDYYSFIYLFWNLFLGWLPLFFIRRIKSGNSNIKNHLFAGLSILFLPNSPYILTDLFHLKQNLHAPLWFDLILILSFAILGLIYFIMAFDLILKYIYKSFSKPVSIIAKPLLLLATGYGIYLGRYLRFNSWDIVSNPYHLAGGIYKSVFNPHYFKETLAVSLTFTVFLYLLFEIYLSFKNKLMLKQDEQL